MPLDRISSATPYAALALVQAATANAPKSATLAAEAFTPAVNATAEPVMAAPSALPSTSPTAMPARPMAMQSREDRLGQAFDARA